jgi:hypothetical protein
MNSQRAKAIAYWLTTGFIAFQFALSGAFSVARPPVVLAGLAHLGYPAYFPLILGTWKLLGVLAILAPRLPRLKEWAYAGILFDLTGAACSHAASGDAAAEVLVPLAFALVTAVSWLLRPESRRLGTLLPASAARPRFELESSHAV